MILSYPLTPFQRKEELWERIIPPLPPPKEGNFWGWVVVTLRLRSATDRVWRTLRLRSATDRVWRTLRLRSATDVAQRPIILSVFIIKSLKKNMQDIRLYLERELVDIDPNSKILETKQVADFFSLKERNTSFTQNFNVLLTGRTLRVLDNVGKPYSVSRKPYGVVRADVYRDSTATVLGGSFRIAEVRNLKGCESVVLRGNIMTGNIGIFEAMADKTLSSLDFKGFNHRLKSWVVEGSQRNWGWEGCFVYAKGNYGYMGAVGERWRYAPPALYVKWLFDAIFKQHGFTYSYVDKDEYGLSLGDDVFESGGIFDRLAITGERVPIDFEPEGKNAKIDYTPEVQLGEFFKGVKQRDIILEVCRMFGLIFKREEGTNHYWFISIRDLFNLSNSVDYSDRLQGTNVIKYCFGGYARRNHFGWLYDADREKLLDSHFDIGNVGLKKWTKLVEGKFKVLAKNADPMLYLEENGVDDKGNVRIKNKSSKPYLITIGANGEATNEGLSWAELRTDYYERLEKAVQHQEFREVEMELTAQDVRNFDFFKLVYLRQYQAYYYCNKIKNYAGGKTTKVELVRVSSVDDEKVKGKD